MLTKKLSKLEAWNLKMIMFMMPKTKNVILINPKLKYRSMEESKSVPMRRKWPVGWLKMDLFL